MSLLADSTDIISVDDLSGGEAFECPFCRRRFEADAEDSPGYVPRIYLSGSMTCYECGTEYEGALLVAEVENGE